MDNAASYVAAGKLLMERHPKIFWSPCAAHCLDLMLEDIGKLGWVKECVERAKNICKFIYNHALVLSIMRQYTGERELARPGITRFASNFLTLKSLLKSKASLRRMFVGEEWTSSSYATTTAEMDVADCFFDEPGPIWDIIDRRLHSQLHRPIHATAYYLNPSFRFRADFKADEKVLSELYSVVQRMGTDTTATLLEMDAFNNASRAIFASQLCKEGRTKLQPGRKF
ncbi:uncharacterized protein LOC131060071 [Cryptomeria japonica]|uniref:uncharacterized protein LOC131060071 n=1 Tax=Cryptomeria japonica TaxID=3369 RepID=UPI0027DA2648|nr:uncharacterized protein LOC131060071 [Cryptomeria japonica]